MGVVIPAFEDSELGVVKGTVVGGNFLFLVFLLSVLSLLFLGLFLFLNNFFNRRLMFTFHI